VWVNNPVESNSVLTP